MSNLPPYNITITHSITQYPEARYFFIQLETEETIMNYTEIEIYDENGNNIASTSNNNNAYAQSSEHSNNPRPASKAFDGDFTVNGIHHTKDDPVPSGRQWLGVNLGSNKKIAGIRIYGRSGYTEDSNAYARTAPFRIYLYKSDEYTGTFADGETGPLNYNDYSLHTKDADVNETISDSNGNQQQFQFDLSQQTKIRTRDFDRAIANYNTTVGFKEAQYFFIQLETENTIMNYAEIEIYDENGTNIASNSNTNNTYAQSSNHSNSDHPASKAFDGDFTVIHHTKDDPIPSGRQWLGVNLSSNKKIAGIRIYGRSNADGLVYTEGGAQYARTAPFRIYLYKSDEYTGTFADGGTGPLNYNDYHLHSNDATVNATINDQQLFFYGITSTIESGITKIGNYAFSSSNLISITIPNSVRTIGEYAFKDSRLTSVNIPNSVTSIGKYTFYGSSYLDDITLHKYKNDDINDNIIDLSGGSLNNKVYTTNVFSNIKRDATFTLFSDEKMDIESFGEFRYVFYERDLTTKTGDGAMVEFEVYDENNDKISDVNTGNPDVLYSSKWSNDLYDPNYIKDDNLTHVTSEWHSRLEKQSIYDVFGNTSGTYKKPFIGYNFGSVKKISKIVLIACGDTTILHKNNIDGDSTDRENKRNGYKLYFTNDIITVTTNDSTTYTPGTYTCVDPSGDYVVRTSYDDAIFDVSFNNTYTHIMEQFKYRYKIIDGTTSIAADEFKDRTDLLSIDISNSVTTIGTDAFNGTTNMTSCTLPNNTSFTIIPNNCFQGSGLTSIDIPDSVTTIGYNAFYLSRELATVTIPNSVTSIGLSAFSYNAITSFTIPDKVETLSNYIFFASNSLASVTIPNSVTSIGNGAFTNTALTSITLPDSVTSIGNEAFRNCSNLRSFKLPNNPNFTTIPQDCFKNSLNWDSPQSIPHSVTTIGSNAFSNGGVQLDNTAYLKLPPTFKDNIPYYAGTNFSETFDTPPNAFETGIGLVLVYNHLDNYVVKNNTSTIFAMDRTGTASNQLDFPSSYKINENNNNSSGLQYFRKGILKDASYNYTDASTLDIAYTNSPYAAAGPIGYKINGMDIGKRIAPYYKIYTSNTNNVKLIPGWTKIGILAIGGGAGGQSGNAQSGGGHYGGAGGGAGGMAFGYFTQNEIHSTNIIEELEITIGNGGAAGAKRSSNGNGNPGTPGGDTIVKYTYAGGGSEIIVKATGGQCNGNKDENSEGGTGEKGDTISEEGIFIKNGDNTGQGLSGASGNNTLNTVGYRQGGSGGTLEDGDYTFNFFEQLTGAVGTGKGGGGGRGDKVDDYGGQGGPGSKGSVFIFQYFAPLLP